MNLLVIEDDRKEPQAHSGFFQVLCGTVVLPKLPGQRPPAPPPRQEEFV